MSALKILLAVLLRAENNANAKAKPTQGSAILSYDEITTLTEVARSMIKPAIDKLVTTGVLHVETGSGQSGNRYFLAHYGETDHFSKISNTTLYRSSSNKRIAVLCDLSSRRKHDMYALKLYLLLCAERDRNKGHTEISYNNIWHRTGIPQNNIRQAISVLIEHGLISVSRRMPSQAGVNTPNQYKILGIQ